LVLANSFITNRYLTKLVILVHNLVVTKNLAEPELFVITLVITEFGFNSKFRSKNQYSQNLENDLAYNYKNAIQKSIFLLLSLKVT
jgi:hypothetical protein